MKLCHVTIYVNDLEESLQFYQTVVGLPVQSRFTAGLGVEIAFLGDGEAKIELIKRPGAEPVFIGKDIAIGFGVPDVEAKRAQLISEGVSAGPMLQPNPNTKFFFVTDPSGVSVQFIQEGH